VGRTDAGRDSRHGHADGASIGVDPSEPAHQPDLDRLSLGALQRGHQSDYRIELGVMGRSCERRTQGVQVRGPVHLAFTIEDMTTDQRARRNAEVFSARARGLTWPTIAVRFNLSERQCRRVCAEHRAESGSLGDIDAADVIRETLDGYDAAIEDLALLAESSTHDGTRLGPIRARLDAVRSRWELLHAVGVLPANLGQLWPEFDAARVARQIVDVLDNHQVSPETPSASSAHNGQAAA
jgi:hypothetical protein